MGFFKIGSHKLFCLALNQHPPDQNKNTINWVAYACDPSYSGGRDQEVLDQGPVPQKKKGFFYCFVCVCVVLGIEPRAWHMLGKLPVIELHL
jgi:hypothetical protein